jgi:hypothetical protein
MARGVPLGAQLRKILDELADALGVQRLQQKTLTHDAAT